MLTGKDEAGKKLEDPVCEFRSGVWRYGVAIVTVALALGLRLALGPWLGNHAPYVLFMLAVAVTVWLAGLGPAIVSAALSVPVALVFAMGEYYPWHTKIIGIVIYAAGAAGIALLGRSMRMARAQAQAAERFRHAVLDALPARIAVLDNAGIVIAVNDRWKELKAGTDYMAICRKFVQTEEPAATHACSLLEALLQGCGGDFQVEYCCPDDDGPRWYLLQASRLPAAIGGVAMAHVDITQRKEAEQALRESQQRLALAASATNVGIFELDLKTDEMLWTPELDRLFGLPSTETAPAAVSRRIDWRGKIHPDDLAGVEAEFDNARVQRRLFECEHRIVWPDGSIHWVQTRGQFYYDNGQALRMLGTVYDVTTKKEAQRQLKQAADDLARSNQDLEQFAHIASHDLKEPLGVMTMYLALLKKKHASALDEEARQFIGHAVDSVGRMGRLINDLLAYSRVGRKTEGFTPTDMQDVLAYTLGNLQASIDESGAAVTHDPLPTIVAERPLMTQLLQNLIGNAIKYRQADQPPRVHVSAIRQEGAWLFSVRDNGIGIRPEDQERIFAIFQRLDTHAHTAAEGTGVGLAICKKIVDHHGGRIWVQSQPGQGSTFFFTIADRDG